MTNTREFKAILVRTGITAEKLAESIGLSQQSLSYKVNNRREFTATEINAISKVLNLTLEEKEKIFFADTVEN
jgi:transcriptional regulator with XRE-family HTH domain